MKKWPRYSLPGLRWAPVGMMTLVGALLMLSTAIAAMFPEHEADATSGAMGSGAIGGGGGGGLSQATADTLYCKLVGCTMTGPIIASGGTSNNPAIQVDSGRMGMWSVASGTRLGIGGTNSGKLMLDINASSDTISTPDSLIFTGVTTDITTGTNEDLTLSPNGSGNILFQKAAGATVKFSDNSSNTVTLTWVPNAFSIIDGGSGTAAMLLSTAGRLGSQAASSATTAFACMSKSITTSSGTDVHCTYGGGLESEAVVQTATCASNAVAVDPVSSVITVDASALTCTITVNGTSATSIGKELAPVRITAKNVGAATLKFASTNFASIPTRCTTTGLTAGQSALIAWSQDQAKWSFLGGCE